MHQQNYMLILRAAQQRDGSEEYKVRNIHYAGSLHSNRFDSYGSLTRDKRFKQQPHSLIS